MHGEGSRERVNELRVSGTEERTGRQGRIGRPLPLATRYTRCAPTPSPLTND